MRVLPAVANMRAASRDAKARGRLGLVPTMGALHQGHLSLVRAANRLDSAVSAISAVNPFP